MYNLKPVAIHAEGKGPVFPKSFSRVVFRIAGENVIRYFDGRSQPAVAGSPQQWCQAFVDLRCRAFVRLDGYNLEDRSYKSAQILSNDVEMFYCDHPETKTPPLYSQYINSTKGN